MLAMLLESELSSTVHKKTMKETLLREICHRLSKLKIYTLTILENTKRWLWWHNDGSPKIRS